MVALRAAAPMGADKVDRCPPDRAHPGRVPVGAHVGFHMRRIAQGQRADDGFG